MPLPATKLLDPGSTPAPVVPTRRPRRVASPPLEPLTSEFAWTAQEMTGEGASHGARGERAPLPDHGSGLGWL